MLEALLRWRIYMYEGFLSSSEVIFNGLTKKDTISKTFCVNFRKATLILITDVAENIKHQQALDSIDIKDIQNLGVVARDYDHGVIREELSCLGHAWYH